MPLSNPVNSSLTTQYSSTTLSVVLCNGLLPQIGDNGGYPGHYLGSASDVMVFNPASDSPSDSKSPELFTIAETIAHCLKYITSDHIVAKKMVFPLAEEQNRKHWVTLYYDPATQIATLVDSFPEAYISRPYDTTAMQRSLNDGLQQLGLQVVDFKVKYQGAQNRFDSTHCGVWTAHNAMALASGTSIDELIAQGPTLDVNIIKQQHIRLAEQLKHELANYLSHAKELAVTENLQAYMDEDENAEGSDFDMGDDEVPTAGAGVTKDSSNSLSSLSRGRSTPKSTTHLFGVHQDAVDVAFSEENQRQWLEEVDADFKQYMQNPHLQLDAVLARGCIKKDNKQLATLLTPDRTKYQDTEQPFNFQTVSGQLDEKYKGTHKSSEVDSSEGVILAAHGHPYENLQKLGLEADLIDELSISESMIYEAVAFTLLSKEAPNLIATSFMPNPDQAPSLEAEALFQKANDAKKAFLTDLSAYVKELIQRHIQERVEPKVKTFTITLLGTDTKYQPYKESDANGPKRGDTLSYGHSVLQGIGRQFYYLSKGDKREEHKEWINEQGLSVAIKPEGKLTHCLLEGPDTAGNDVYKRIAKAVVESLNAMMRGDTTINLTGHSRGAVEAILVAHELDRIQQAILVAPKPCTYESILAIIVNSDGSSDGYFSTGSKKSLESCLEDFTKEGFSFIGALSRDVDNKKQALTNYFCDQIKSLSVNILALDPVPGGSWQGLNAAKWEDKRFYQLPGIVRYYKQWFMANERSRCFEAIIPTRHEHTAQYEIVSMLGHHSSPAGTAHGQDKTPLKVIASYCNKELLDLQNNLKPGLTTADVQTLFLYTLHDFATMAGVSFITERQMGEAQKSDIDLDALCFEYNQKHQQEKESLKLSCYQAINNNRAVYEMFNRWCYLTGQPGDKTRFLTNIAGGSRQRGDLPREVRWSDTLTSHRDEHFTELTEVFVNFQHINLYLKLHLGNTGKLSDYIQNSLNSERAKTILTNMLSPLSRRSSPAAGASSNSSEESCKSLLKQAMVLRLFSTLEAFLKKAPQDAQADLMELRSILENLPTLSPLDDVDSQPKDVVINFYQEIRAHFREQLNSFFEERMREIKLKVELYIDSLCFTQASIVDDQELFSMRYQSMANELTHWQTKIETLKEMVAQGNASFETQEIITDCARQLKVHEITVTGAYRYLLEPRQPLHAEDELATLLERNTQLQQAYESIQHQLQALQSEHHNQQLSYSQQLHSQQVSHHLEIDALKQDHGIMLSQQQKVAEKQAQALEVTRKELLRFEGILRNQQTRHGLEVDELIQAHRTELLQSEQRMVELQKQALKEAKDELHQQYEERMQLVRVALAEVEDKRQTFESLNSVSEAEQKILSEQLQIAKGKLLDLQIEFDIMQHRHSLQTEEIHEVYVDEIKALGLEIAQLHKLIETERRKLQGLHQLDMQHQNELRVNQQQELERNKKIAEELRQRIEIEKEKNARVMMSTEELQQKMEAEQEKNARAMMSAEELLGNSCASLQKSLLEMKQQRDDLLEQRDASSPQTLQPQLPAYINPEPFSDISWNVMHGFMMALGAAVVAVAVTALALGSAGMLPVAVAVAGGTLLTALGLFGLTKISGFSSEVVNVPQVNL